MGAEANVSGALAQQATQLAETAVSGIGTLLGGLDAIINPQVVVPPMIGMTSSDFMNLGISAIMASTSTNLAFAKQQAAASGDEELVKLAGEAERSRQKCALKFSPKAERTRVKAVTETTRPTQTEVETFYNSCKKLLAAQNTQSIQLALYSQYKNGVIAEARGTNLKGFSLNWRGLLRKIIKGADTVFKYAEKAKTIYEKAKPYLEEL